MPDISPNVVILTREELSQRERAAFQRGIERGKFEALSSQNQQPPSSTLTDETTAKTSINREAKHG